MRKTILIAGVAICIICAALISYGLFTQRDAMPSQDLTLSDYPKLFAKEAVIVIGENASQTEIESAETIAANLENLMGNKPEIINTKKIESFKYSYNLIIVGTSNSNEVLREVYEMTNATRVTEEYPGEGKGILEILRNPWNEEKAMLLVEGSDEWGVKAGSEMLTEGEIIVAEFANIKEVGLVVGGHCIYSHYSGVAVVTRIEKTEKSKRQARTSEEQGYEGYEVWFVFKTDQEIKEDWACKSVTRECLFQLANSWYPGPKYLEKYHIKVGGNYNCTLKVIRSGTCTPIIFEFDQLKRDDYFESSSYAQNMNPTS